MAKNILGSEDSDSEIVAFMQALTENETLTDLDLSEINLCSEQAILFAELLPFNKTLERLDLRNNPLDQSGIMAISNALKLNNTLLEIQIAPLLNKKSNYKRAMVVRCFYFC